MSTSFIDAKEPSKENKEETSTVKYKLRISLIFRTIAPSQKAKAKGFRKKEKGDEVFSGNDLAQELSGGQICYTDKDDGGEYIIEDKTFVVDEGSPKAMMNLSKGIDNYIMGFCLQDDVEKVAPCFIIPSVSDTSVIPTLFFHSFPPVCIQKETQKGPFEKIDNQKGYVYFFGFDSIQSYTNSISISSITGQNASLTKTHIHLFALISYYVYFYIDYFEQKNWTLLKNDIKQQKYIDEFLKNYLEKKTPKKNRPEKPSIWKKIGNTIAESFKLPFKTVDWVADFLLNYDGHVTKRIFTRIAEVVEITASKASEVSEQEFASQTSKVISNILSACEKDRPVGLYSFFEKCKYWEYLKTVRFDNLDNLKAYCKKWEVLSSTAGIVSGYGAVLFSDGKDYIYAFKGTDMDSYGRDWILTNLLQGLTGFSLQHLRAIADGSDLDERIANMGSLWFTGHSLGGGLASAATIATKYREGVTFNAAGLNVIGVKTTQLIKNIGSIFHPSQSWKRVYPYRIKGEVLDKSQQTILRAITLGTLERGYGKQSVEYEINANKKDISCVSKHGINNFLHKEVMEKLDTFEKVEHDASKSSENNKIVPVTITMITIKGKESESVAHLSN